jgi:hypothetical protein
VGRYGRMFDLPAPILPARESRFKLRDLLAPVPA